MISLSSLLLVFTLFLIKHFIADFVLKTSYMLKRGWGPLVTHCLVHAGFTLLILLYVQPTAFYLAGLDFLAHLAIDRTKQFLILPQGAWPQEKRAHYLDIHYFVFGLDQLAHQLTYIVLIYLLYGR